LGQPSHGAGGRECLPGDAYELEQTLTVDALAEVIRLLESGKFRELSSEQIRAVGEYASIEVGGERFFERSFTTGKGSAASLGFAKHVGRRRVLEDLLNLRATLLGESSASFEAP
jgi:hypothetical protein